MARLGKAVGRVLVGTQWMLMNMESVYVVVGCNVVPIEHGRYSLPCMQKL